LATLQSAIPSGVGMVFFFSKSPGSFKKANTQKDQRKVKGIDSAEKQKKRWKMREWLPSMCPILFFVRVVSCFMKSAHKTSFKCPNLQWVKKMTRNRQQGLACKFKIKSQQVIAFNERLIRRISDTPKN
jgi:hypothetical protein